MKLGHLIAAVNGTRCDFDGDVWTSPDSRLAQTLNDCLEFIPKTHATILDLARLTFDRAGMTDQAVIADWKADRLPDLPDDAID